MFDLAILAVLALAVIVIVAQSVRIVPQQTAFVVERLGRYHVTMEAGPHILIPFIDRVAYKIPLQEIPLDTAPQAAITRDNVTVTMDGVLYYQVTDPRAAAYGTANYQFAIENLAKTTLRSAAGQRELDKLLEDREALNRAVVDALDEASVNWGVKVKRYEVKDITPPESVLRAMQMQLEAEREKRARIARSEGAKTEQINIAEGERQAAIAKSEGEKQAAINRAHGEAEAIRTVADATAAAIAAVGGATEKPGGIKAVELQVAERYVAAFGEIAKESTTLVVPANLGDLASLMTTGMQIVGRHKAAAAS